MVFACKIGQLSKSTFYDAINIGNFLLILHRTKLGLRIPKRGADCGGIALIRSVHYCRHNRAGFRLNRPGIVGDSKV